MEIGDLCIKVILLPKGVSIYMLRTCFLESSNPLPWLTILEMV